VTVNVKTPEMGAFTRPVHFAEKKSAPAKLLMQAVISLQRQKPNSLDFIILVLEGFVSCVKLARKRACPR
jgi:hypothetical protein